MKEFIFNEDKRCINPNRVECGDKEFWIEIQTACYDGKWYHGYQYWTHGNSFKSEIYKDTYPCENECEAICEEIDHIIWFFKNDLIRIVKHLDIPEKIFTELNDLKEKTMHPQLSIF